MDVKLLTSVRGNGDCQKSAVKKIDFLKGDTLNSRVYICYALSPTNAQTLDSRWLLI